MLVGMTLSCQPHCSVYRESLRRCVNSLQLYLSEAARVLHPGGLLYISWYPSWQSGRGHHIHPDMVRTSFGIVLCKVVFTQPAHIISGY